MKSVQDASKAQITEALAVFVDESPLAPLLVFTVP